MIVTYFGTKGNVRMVYLNVASYIMKPKGVVELLSVEHWQNTENGKAIIESGNVGSFNCHDSYKTMALINLAPGEYLEWGNDAERS